MGAQIGQFRAEQCNAITQPDDWIMLSLTQPWASAIFDGKKTIETRGWKTNYRGTLYIHASKRMTADDKLFAKVFGGYDAAKLPLGVIIGSVVLLDCFRTEDARETITEQERTWGNYDNRRWAWMLAGPALLPEPIPARGQLGLWKWRVR